MERLGQKVWQGIHVCHTRSMHNFNDKATTAHWNYQGELLNPTLSC
jgi:hypothetical protein